MTIYRGGAPGTSHIFIDVFRRGTGNVTIRIQTNDTVNNSNTVSVDVLWIKYQ